VSGKLLIKKKNPDYERTQKQAKGFKTHYKFKVNFKINIKLLDKYINQEV
jgi:hypothetical protein